MEGIQGVVSLPLVMDVVCTRGKMPTEKVCSATVTFTALQSMVTAALTLDWLGAILINCG